MFLAERLPTFSRAALQRAIEAGQVRVDDAACKPSLKLRAGNVVAVLELEVPREGPMPQDIPLDILHEDDAIVVVNKAGRHDRPSGQGALGRHARRRRWPTISAR